MKKEILRAHQRKKFSAISYTNPLKLIGTKYFRPQIRPQNPYYFC